MVKLVTLALFAARLTRLRLSFWNAVIKMKVNVSTNLVEEQASGVYLVSLFTNAAKHTTATGMNLEEDVRKRLIRTIAKKKANSAHLVIAAMECTTLLT